MIGYIFALLSAFAISVSGIAAKQALKREHSLDFSLFAHILGFLFLAPFVIWVDFGISKYHLGLIYLVSVFSTFGFWFMIRALRHMDISVETPLSNIGILFTVFFGYIFLGERLGVWHLVGVVFIVAGAYLLEINHSASSGASRSKIDVWYPLREFKNSRYIHFLLAGLVLYSLSSVVDRVVLQEISVITYLFFVYLFLTINNILLFVFLHKVPFSVVFKEAKDSAGWAVLFAVSRLISNFLFANAISVLYVGVAVAIKRISTLLTVVLGGKFLSEENLRWRMMSSAVMIVGALLIVFA